MNLAEREFSESDGLSMREVRCIRQNGPQLSVVSSDRELNLHRIAARMSIKFTAFRFLNCLQKNWALVRSINAQQGATDTAGTKVGRGLEAFIGSVTMVVFRAEAITKQILREQLPLSLGCPSVLQDILSERIDLVPVQGTNILKVYSA